MIFAEVGLEQFTQSFKQSGQDFTPDAFRYLFDHYERGIQSGEYGEHVLLSEIVFYREFIELPSFREAMLYFADLDFGFAQDDRPGDTDEEKSNKVLEVLQEYTTAFLLPNNHFLVMPF